MRNLVVKSAIELTRGQKTRLEEGLRKKINDSLEITYVIDAIVGGLVVIDGENYIDASFATELLNIKKLAKGVVANSAYKIDDVATFGENIRHKLMEVFSHEEQSMVDSPFAKIIKGSLPVSNCGRVVNIADGVVRLSGLSQCKSGELLRIGKMTYAIAMNLESDGVGAIIVNDDEEVDCGDIAYATGHIAEIPVGEGLLGRVITPLGLPADGLKTVYSEKMRKLESPAPGIVSRGKVDEPLYTGTLAVDAMVPIGKGQRELIIGDRQTGKTSLAVDAILNQKNKNVKCVYVSIGQRAGVIADVLQTLKRHDAMEYTVVVASTADDPAPLQYLAPYAGCAVAEEFMYSGQDVLIVYDDLSKHAVAYRTISLLLKRPAGREAYPGDIFYIHSRLLERAAKLSEKLGGGSMTALPIIETQEGDISAYIPTNVISITDGQIYLEKELFRAGIRPAINVGLSVSRVGGSAQVSAMRKLSSKLRLNLAHYRELSVFSQFGSELDDSTKKILQQGEKATEALKQPVNSPITELREIFYLYVIENGVLCDIDTKKILPFMAELYDFFRASQSAESKEILTTGSITEHARKGIDEAITQFKAYYLSKEF